MPVLDAVLDAEFLNGVHSFFNDNRELWISEVQNQYSTLCCWGFASSDAIYTLQYMMFNEAEKVSVQELFDRVHEKYPPGYAEFDNDGNILYKAEGYGNSATKAFEYVSNFGVSFDADWPFKMVVSATSDERDQLDLIIKEGRRLFISGCRAIPNEDHARVREVLNEQTVTTVVYGARSLKRWKSHYGVYQGLTDEERTSLHTAQENGGDLPFTNHIMLLVGYGDDPTGGPYYLAKDSYGIESGYKGFYKIAESACRTFVYPVGCKIVEKNDRTKGKKASQWKEADGKAGTNKKKGKEKEMGPRKEAKGKSLKQKLKRK